jgi:hypothetical protein
MRRVIERRCREVAFLAHSVEEPNGNRLDGTEWSQFWNQVMPSTRFAFGVSRTQW